jgi:hypothetical protein
MDAVDTLLTKFRGGICIFCYLHLKSLLRTNCIHVFLLVSVELFNSKQHINYKDLAIELRKDGIDKVFTEKENVIKAEFMFVTLTKSENEVLKDNKAPGGEKNRIKSNANQKFYKLKEYLLDVVREIIV